MQIPLTLSAQETLRTKGILVTTFPPQAYPLLEGAENLVERIKKLQDPFLTQLWFGCPVTARIEHDRQVYVLGAHTIRTSLPLEAVVMMDEEMTSGESPSFEKWFRQHVSLAKRDIVIDYVMGD